MAGFIDMSKNFCIMQIWAESGKSALPIRNYSQILYQFFMFTQNLKRSHQNIKIPFDTAMGRSPKDTTPTIDKEPQILYQFFTFTQNLKRSRRDISYPRYHYFKCSPLF